MTNAGKIFASACLALSCTAHAADCSVNAIKIKSMRAGFAGGYLKGVGVLNNGCTMAVGVQLKIVGLDKSGAPVAVRDLWPASIRNIPPGDYTFSLDHWLDYSQQIKQFTLEPIEVRVWK